MGDPSFTPDGTFNNGGTAQDDGVSSRNTRYPNNYPSRKESLVADVSFLSASLAKTLLDVAQSLPARCQSATLATHSATAVTALRRIWDTYRAMVIRQRSLLSMLCNRVLDLPRYNHVFQLYPDNLPDSFSTMNLFTPKIHIILHNLRSHYSEAEYCPYTSSDAISASSVISISICM